MRSASAPETMVAAVAAKAHWKKKTAASETPSVSVSPPRAGKNEWPPMKPPWLVPNAKPKPTAHQTTPPSEASSTFFIRMLAVFLTRTKPASSIPNPACMKKTRMPAMTYQMVSTARIRSATASASCAAAMPRVASRAVARPAARPMPARLAPRGSLLRKGSVRIPG